MIILTLLIGAILGFLASYLVGDIFWKKQTKKDVETKSDLNEIKEIILEIKRWQNSDLEKAIFPILNKINDYIVSLYLQSKKVITQQKSGKNREVELLVGEIEMLKENFHDMMRLKR